LTNSNVPQKSTPTSPMWTSSIVSQDTINKVENLYLAAARLSPQQSIDPDIQVC